MYRCLLSCIEPPTIVNRGTGLLGRADGESEFSSLDGELISARVRLFTALGACLDATFRLTWEARAFTGRVDADAKPFPQWAAGAYANDDASWGLKNSGAQAGDATFGGRDAARWTKGIRNCLAFSTECVALRASFQTRAHLQAHPAYASGY